MCIEKELDDCFQDSSYTVVSIATLLWRAEWLVV